MTSPEDRTDSEHDVGFDEQALYVVVRKAVEDGILGATGKLVQIGVSVLIVWFGMLSAFSEQSIIASVSWVVVAILGLYLIATALEIIPSVRDWF
ncbi:hypothetical protein NDI76_21985 [Halogeometricum sp. S1BR25-6]|uniref:Uncharacterized protein n=1 Tax=Halogeometricum salsisoli TaxID=2950536 RepID=A0ABU2GMV1_9EURY|nr:hypothetical protein [Halogeometricum sp. S1BR25-6]MDS0301403.1 hypothetical protein [Halogeometricum sp. S1BR25-6]